MERNLKDLGLVAGANLKRLIKESGMTQDCFAFDFGTDERNVRRWIAKGINSLRTLQEIADYFGIDVLDILSH